MVINEVARVCHEVNRAYCAALGETQPPWDSAPDWQKESAAEGVRFHLRNPGSPPEASHREWLRKKQGDGWTFGPLKNAAKKQHPCFVPFDHLPQAQRAKDHIFSAIVNALAPFVTDAHKAR